MLKWGLSAVRGNQNVGLAARNAFILGCEREERGPRATEAITTEEEKSKLRHGDPPGFFQKKNIFEQYKARGAFMKTRWTKQAAWEE